MIKIMKKGAVFSMLRIKSKTVFFLNFIIAITLMFSQAICAQSTETVSNKVDSENLNETTIYYEHFPEYIYETTLQRENYEEIIEENGSVTPGAPGSLDEIIPPRESGIFEVTDPSFTEEENWNDWGSEFENESTYSIPEIPPFRRTNPVINKERQMTEKQVKSERIGQLKQKLQRHLIRLSLNNYWNTALILLPMGQIYHLSPLVIPNLLPVLYLLSYI